MSILQSILYGIVQGLTEFLPISSTAHIRILPALAGWSDPGAAFTAIIQFGTMLAVIVYFRNEILSLSRAFIRSCISLRPFETTESKLAWWIAIATLPIVLFGFTFKEMIETSFRSLWVVAAALVALALVLLYAEKRSRFHLTMDDQSMKHSFLYGCAQALALIPGASRSGVTITAGMLLGYTREAAARFSFLLSIPAVALSGLYELYSLRHELTADFSVSLVAATVVSFIIGYLSIAFLLRFLRTHTMYAFIGYRLLIGIALFALLSFGKLQP